MSPQKPYLLEALYQWMVDNNCTPYLVVQSEGPGVEVPLEFAQDGKVTLNVSPRATHNLLQHKERWSFEASFGGQVKTISIPVWSVSAIFAKENGQGMGFEVEQPPEDPKPTERAGLRLVK